MPISTNTLSEQLQQAANNVGFINSEELLNSLSITPPEATFIMHNNYAFLIGCAVPDFENEEETITFLKDAHTRSTEWTKKILLLLEENNGLLIDGYLVFLLNTVPSAKLKAQIREIELDSGVCRKHVVWPNTETDSDTLQFVTALSLPPSPAGLPHLRNNLTFSEEATFVLEKYKELKSADRVLEAIKGAANVTQ